MKVISILNQKGGSGKTTLSTNLARALQLMGNDVLLIDSDPQGSATDWYAACEEQTVPVLAMPKPRLEACIKEISHGKDYILIDGAPQAHDLAVSAIKASDFVLIPARPSPFDVWASGELVNRVKERIDITDGKLKAAFVISGAITGTRIASDLEEVLSGYNLPVLKARTCERVVYPMCAAAGKTVFDFTQRDPKAAEEIQSIANEIVENLSL